MKQFFAILLLLSIAALQGGVMSILFPTSLALPLVILNSVCLGWYWRKIFTFLFGKY